MNWLLRYSWIYVVAVILAGIRIAGHKSQSFQAAAHLFVGGLLGAAISELCRGGDGWKFGAANELAVAIALSIVEVACFIWFA